MSAYFTYAHMGYDPGTPAGWIEKFRHFRLLGCSTHNSWCQNKCISYVCRFTVQINTQYNQIMTPYNS